jgi:hypothetical protein
VGRGHPVGGEPVGDALQRRAGAAIVSDGARGRAGDGEWAAETDPVGLLDGEGGRGPLPDEAAFQLAEDGRDQRRPRADVRSRCKLVVWASEQVGDIGPAVSEVAAASGGQLASIDIELVSDSPFGELPADRPAWYWCTLTPGGREWLASVEGLVGSSPSWVRTPDQGAARVFLLSGAGRAAELFESTWVDFEGVWHAEWRFRPLTASAAIAELFSSLRTRSRGH